MNYVNLDIEQGTPEWHQYRAGGINGTESAAIMGMDPYASVMDLWKIKLGIQETEKQNAEMFHGKLHEDEARDWFVKRYGITMKPSCVHHKDYSFIKASLDGISSDGKFLLEIKCPAFYGSFVKHQKSVLPYYYAQIQHQSLITGAEKIYFLSYFRQGKSFVDVCVWEIFQNAEFQEEMLRREILFNDLLEKQIPPDESDFLEYDYVI